MSKLQGATSVLVLVAVGLAVASLVFNILIYNNQVATTDKADPSTSPAACPILTPTTPPPTTPSPDDDAEVTTEPDDSATTEDPWYIPPVISHDEHWKEAANRILATANLSIDPCDDFYQFTCGKYLQDTDLEGESSKGTADEAQYSINLGLADYFDSHSLQELWSQTEKYQKNFFDMCVTDRKRNTADSTVTKAKLKILSEDINKTLGFPLFSVKAVQENMADVWHAMGAMERQFTGGPLLTSIVTSDFKEKGKNALYLNQPALHFDRDFYTKSQFSDELQAYADYVRDLILAYSAFGKIDHNFCNDNRWHLTDKDCAQKVAEWAVGIERDLAIASSSDEDLRNYQQQYTKGYWNLVLLNHDYQSLDMGRYVKGLLNIETDELNGFMVVLAQPSYFAALEMMFRMNTISLDEFTNYLALHVLIDNAAEYGIDIPSSYENTSRNQKSIKPKFHGYMARSGHGARRIKHRPVNFKDLAANENDAVRVSCIDTLIEYMPYGPGFTYAKNRNDKDIVLKDLQSETNFVIRQIGYYKMIQSLDWLDAASMKHFADKMFNLVENLLWPDFFGDFNNFDAIDSYHQKYAGLGDINGLTFWDALNVLRSGFLATEQLDIVDKPRNRTNFLISPASVGAWYQPEHNSITIPLGLMNPPYYDLRYPQAYKYAGVGAAMAREFWRAYDEEGAQFDNEGMLADCSFSGCSILGRQSRKSFDDMAQCVERQFDSKCIPLENSRCANGDATLTENMSDIGGVETAYYAYRYYNSGEKNTRLPGLEQFTTAQVFWMSYGASMCTKITDETNQLMTDSHSPSSCRVNQVVQDIPRFGQDFSCKRGVSRMYPEEEDRCKVWIGTNGDFEW